MEQAMMIASLIGHNEAVKCGYRVPQIDECNAALKRGLLCMIEVHGLQSELLEAIAKSDPAMDGMSELGGLTEIWSPRITEGTHGRGTQTRMRKR